MQRDPSGPIPAETVRIAQAAFPKGTLCIRLRDTVGTISTDDVVVDVFSSTGRPAEAPWRLALVSIVQYVEDLSDRQAAYAVRARSDWTYVLGLELTDSGFDCSILSDFRARLIAAQAQQRICEHLGTQLGDGRWLKKRGIPHTDSTHVLAAVLRRNRLELLGETPRAALNSVAEHAPEWLQGSVPPAWFEQDSRRIEAWQLPGAKHKQAQVMPQSGPYGARLLAEMWRAQAHAPLRHLAEVEGVRRT